MTHLLDSMMDVMHYASADPDREPLPDSHAWVFCRECGNAVLLHTDLPAFCSRQACGRVAARMKVRQTNGH
jgi:hypothetical protein